MTGFAEYRPRNMAVSLVCKFPLRHCCPVGREEGNRESLKISGQVVVVQPA